MKYQLLWIFDVSYFLSNRSAKLPKLFE